jgi:NCS1 family nucleobase:cation symporter-1
MGAIGGVMIVDYWLARRRKLDVGGLFERRGAYRFSAGWNLRALAATLIGLFIAWGGLVIPAMHELSTYGWFAGFFGAGLTYWALMAISPPPPVEDVTTAEADPELLATEPAQ